MIDVKHDDMTETVNNLFENLVNYDRCQTFLPEKQFAAAFENLVNYDRCQTKRRMVKKWYRV